MANDVTLSAGVRANLLSLQNTASMMGKIQERLSTGKKVNSAIDNPVNFFTASSLQARAGDLSTLLDGISNSIQTVNAADKGISAITKLIESAKSTVDREAGSERDRSDLQLRHDDHRHGRACQRRRSCCGCGWRSHGHR
jgi:flagellin